MASPAPRVTAERTRAATDLDRQKISVSLAATILVFLVTIFVTGAWYASGLTFKIENCSTQIATLKQSFEASMTDRYTAKDAARDIRDRDRTDADLQSQINSIKVEIQKAAK